MLTFLIIAVIAVVVYIVWRKKNADKAAAFETKVTGQVSDLEQKAKDAIDKLKK